MNWLLFFYALLLTQCTKGLNETCSFALTLRVISSVVISLVFLCLLVSYVVFFPKCFVDLSITSASL